MKYMVELKISKILRFNKPLEVDCMAFIVNTSLLRGPLSLEKFEERYDLFNKYLEEVVYYFKLNLLQKYFGENHKEKYFKLVRNK